MDEADDRFNESHSAKFKPDSTVKKEEKRFRKLYSFGAEPECIACTLIAEDPVRLPCNCTKATVMCLECYKKWFQNNGNCPSCMCSITSRHLRRIGGIEKLVDVEFSRFIKQRWPPSWPSQGPKASHPPSSKVKRQISPAGELLSVLNQQENELEKERKRLEDEHLEATLKLLAEEGSAEAQRALNEHRDAEMAKELYANLNGIDPETGQSISARSKRQRSSTTSHETVSTKQAKTQSIKCNGSEATPQRERPVSYCSNSSTDRCDGSHKPKKHGGNSSMQTSQITIILD